MHTRRKQHNPRYILPVFFLVVFLAFGFSSSHPDVSAATLPAQVLNLTNWKETLPTGSSGSPTEILQSSLSSFSTPPYFQVNSTGNGVQFRAPVNGVTTSGSGYPRSELREMTNNGTTQASWSTTSGTHAMYIDEAITAVPQTKKHVVAGQIHDASDDVIVIRLEYPKLFIDINGVTGPTLDANYTLGKRFQVIFMATNGQIKIYYNGGATPAYTLNKSGSGNYFKAGAYTQSNCSKEAVCSSSNYGEVVVYNLAVQHATANAAPILTSMTTPLPTPIPAPTPTPTPTPTTTPTPTPTPTPTTTPTPTPTPTVGTSFEAESGTVTAPMQIVSDANAAGGKYVVQTTDTGTGRIQYSVAIPTAGQYQLSAKVIAPNGSSNSVYYSLDGGSTNTWNFPDTLTDWTWTDGPIINLTQGTHTFLVTKREKNTKLDAFAFKAITATTTSSAIDGTQAFEAESGNASGGMSIQTNDPTATGGKYVQADASGSMTYQINMPTAGTYRVAGWIRAANGSSDSFYVSLDGSSSKTWTLAAPTTAWTYDLDDSNTFTLSAGNHKLTLKYREAGAKVDRLILVKQ
ncbi:MAG: polysaccharide lyase family 7 protein [Parcubacteria group bacterium]|jgi:hypothetical protein